MYAEAYFRIRLLLENPVATAMLHDLIQYWETPFQPT
jgi:hypothetical protein